MENVTAEQAIAIIAYVQKIPDIRAAMLFEEGMEAGATSGRYYSSRNAPEGYPWEIDATYYEGSKNFGFYVSRRS